MAQGGTSQFEFLLDRTVAYPLFSQGFVKQLTKEHLELYQERKRHVKKGKIEASHFVSREVIRDLLGDCSVIPPIPAHQVSIFCLTSFHITDMMSMQEWRFIALLDGPGLEDHFRDTGDFNSRNGICATHDIRDLMDTFQLSYVPLTADDPEKVFSNFLHR